MLVSVGGELHANADVDYVPIGLLAYNVSINWPDLVGVGPLPVPTLANDAAVMLHDLGRDYLLVDLAFPDTDEPFFEPGEIYTLDTYATIVPHEQFDAYVYLDESPQMDSLVW